MSEIRYEVFSTSDRTRTSCFIHVKVHIVEYEYSCSHNFSSCVARHFYGEKRTRTKAGRKRKQLLL